MKKFIVSAALVLASFTSTAVFATPLLNTIVVAQDEYKEIEVKDVPKAISDSITGGGYTISKAYVNAASEYKLEIASGDKTATVYYKADGTQIQK